MNSPLVSIVMPVYNAMPYLQKALISLVKQDYANIEIIIVDDASTDDSGLCIHQFAQKYTAIQLVTLPPKIADERRTAMALNIGISKSKGKYIALMDADDWCAFNRISLQVAFMQTHTNLIASGTHAHIKWESKGFFKPSKAKHALTHNVLKIYALKQSPFFQNSVIMDAEMLLKYNLKYDENMHYAEDYDFFSRLIQVGEVANLDAFLVTYRIHKNQSIQSPNFEQYVKQITLQNWARCIEMNTQQLQWHWDLMNHRKPTSIEQLRVLWEWKNQLLAINNAQHYFDVTVFENFMNDCWNKKFKTSAVQQLPILFSLCKPTYKHFWEHLTTISKFKIGLKTILKV